MSDMKTLTTISTSQGPEYYLRSDYTDLKEKTEVRPSAFPLTTS